MERFDAMMDQLELEFGPPENSAELLERILYAMEWEFAPQGREERRRRARRRAVHPGPPPKPPPIPVT